MALIKCGECGTEVSDRAEKCPKCANPIATQKKSTGVQVIEKTSKRLKLQKFLSLIIIFGGLGLLSSNTEIGVILIIVGFVLFTITRISIWWRHK